MYVLKHPPRRVPRIVSKCVVNARDLKIGRPIYLGFLTESNKFGINPCFKVLANASMCCRAPSKFPVVKNNPLSEINTSLPQHLAQLPAK